MPTLMERSGALVVYGDFGCAMCYLASQRVDELTRAGVAVEWCAVEHRPELPVTGLRPDADTRSAADRALADARALGRPGERLPVAGPALVPKTQAAVSAYAEGCGAQVGDAIRRLLFTAYWVDGMDIGNPAVLLTLLGGTFMRGEATSEPIREWGFAVTVTGGPITTRAWHLIRDWNQEWQTLGRPELPSLWDGTRVHSGEQALMQHADVNGVAICLVRNNGQVYALHDECTHAEVQLSEGEVSNGTIGCWLHGSRFDLATGRCAQPARHRAGRGLSGQAHQGWRGPHLPGSS